MAHASIRLAEESSRFRDETGSGVRRALASLQFRPGDSLPLRLLWLGLRSGEWRIAWQEALVPAPHQPHELRITVSCGGTGLARKDASVLEPFLLGEQAKSIALGANRSSSAISRKQARALGAIG